MLNPRFIPVLLLRGSGLVKTQKFGGGRYLGDAINAVNIFSEKMVDEIMVIDIDASRQGRAPNFDLVRDMAAEAFMPLSFGGGVQSLKDIERLLRTGAEKVSLNTAFHRRPELVREAADRFGSQAVVVSIDVKRGFRGEPHVVTSRGTKPLATSPLECARIAQESGAGEILLQSVDRDGMWTGYDLPLIRQISASVKVPLIALGGARDVDDLAAAIVQGGASGAAAGSMFVFHGRLKAILITVPTEEQRRDALKAAADTLSAAAPA